MIEIVRYIDLQPAKLTWNLHQAIFLTWLVEPFFLDKCKYTITSSFHHASRVARLLCGHYSRDIIKGYCFKAENRLFISEPIKIYRDNASIVFDFKNNKASSGLEHIEINYLIIKDKIKKGKATIMHINTEAMVVVH